MAGKQKIPWKRSATKSETFEKYGKLEAARVKLVIAMRFIDEAETNTREAGLKIREWQNLPEISGCLNIIGLRVIDAMDKIEGRK